MWLLSSQDAPCPMGSGFSVSAKLCILKGEVVILIQAPPTGVNPRQDLLRHFEAFNNMPRMNEMIRIQDLLPQIKQVIPIILPRSKKFVRKHEAAHQRAKDNVGISLIRQMIFIIDNKNLSFLL